MNDVLEDPGCNSICIDSNRYHYEMIDWTKIDSFMFPRKMASCILHTCEATLPNIFEFEFQRNPFRVKLWISYLDCNKCSPRKDRFMMYERALAVLPRSYKLWYRYLQERIAGVVGEPPMSDCFQEINCLFERCLVYLTLMPVLWLQYLDFLRLQPYVTKTRRCYNRALQTLPVTQHKEIWESYCDFVKRVNIPLVSTIVYQRYIMYDSTQIGEYIELLKQVNQIDKAAMILVETLSQDIVSVKGKTTHQLWLDLCDLISDHPQEIKSLNVEAILRSGLRKFAEQVAQLWCSLAKHYVQLNQMEKARDIYEEALEAITTASDFGIIYEAYTQFMESILSTFIKMNNNSTQVDLYIERLEDLLQRRPILLSSVKLRQNPHNVILWLQRVQYFLPKQPLMAVKTFTEAVLTVNPFEAVGKVTNLWIQFAEYYEAHDEIENVNDIFEKAVKAKYRHVEELATIWCAWVEYQLRRQNGRRALEIARQALHKPLGKPPQEKGYFQHVVHRVPRLWSLCTDMEECFGTLSTLEACYDKMFDLKVITPEQILNYTNYLIEKHYWEKAFRIFERGVAILRWPHVSSIWITYLATFVSRYGGRKIERARELFEQALHDAPRHLSKTIFLMYGKLEETYGLVRHCIAVYDRASRYLTVPQDIYDVFMLLIAKTCEYFGITQTRSIFERAINVLESLDNGLSYLLQLGLRFVEIERSLGEIDRARGVLQHLSQFCNPSKQVDFWQTWRQFEIVHGNEDLFREMLRTKQAVHELYMEDFIKNTDSMLKVAKERLQTPETKETPMDQLEKSIAMNKEPTI